MTHVKRAVGEQGFTNLGKKMSFSIRLEGKVLREFDEWVLPGEVEIDGYTETFLAPAEFWSREDYLKSWKRSLAQGLQGGGRAVLLTSMRDPGVCNFLFYWVIFLEGDFAYIQNGVFFREELPGPFDPNGINGFVSDRQEINEDGVAISQWKVDLSSVIDFYNSL
ncbi:hypothetical protein [Achromobacter deleyi]|uniref:hypothetical protein n=1 Tax=Achromobacter deleyi TaxID=1353891 RepID=UPI001490A0C0|nr:hypothetical protein [Achromobacter deleyi]QVQ28280.1 hypothetical protein HLG70_07660 [Achromobacter deleyi]